MKLRYKFLIPFALLLAITVAGHLWVGLPELADNERREILKQERLYLDLLGVSITTALLSNDLGQLYATLDSIKQQHDNWQVLSVFDTNAQALYPLSNLSPPDDSHYEWLEQPIFYDTEPLGKLRVAVDIDSIVAIKLAYVETLVMWSWGLLGLGMALIIVFLELHIRKPLLSLAEAARRLAQGRYERALIGVVHNDEIGAFARDFEHMRATLQDQQNALIESEQRLQSVFQSTAEAIITIDRSGKIQDFNRAAEQMFGYGFSEVMGRNIDRLMPEPYRSAHDGYLQRYLSTGISGILDKSRELLAQRRNGEVFPIRLAVSEVPFNEDGLFVGAVMDITEQKTREQELRKHFRAVEDSPVGIVITDPHSIIEYVNPAYSQISGYSEADLLGQNIRMIKSGKILEPFYQSLHQELSQGRTFRGEFRNRRKDGKEFWARNSISPVRDDDGVIVHYVAITEDITEQKHTEAELRHHKDNLEALVAEQTRDLLRAKDQAESANQAKSRFLANMSHELRTPMNAIIGMSQLVLEGPLDNEPRKLLSIVLNSARSLLKLLNEILDLSKLEGDKMAFEQVLFHLPETLEDTLLVLTASAHAKGLALSLQIDPSVPQCVVGDAHRLSQIITNLVGNAIKFTQQGSVEVQVSCPRPDWMHFVISDTGIGIASDRLTAIFDSFTQADNSTARRFGGTGLGTTICKQLLEKMGGRIWVDSEMGAGSQFHFELPLPRATTDNCRRRRDTLNAAIDDGRSFKVLLAEDIEENILLATIRLNQSGHQVMVARNGKQAVEMFQQHRFDLILMDIQMPELDGFGATRAIRAIEQASGGHIPIIALTASVMKSDQLHCEAAGMDAFVGKPVDFEHLFQTIANLLPERSDAALASLADSGTYVADMPSLPGIDKLRGLRTWRDAAAYRKALLSFASNHGNDIECLQQQLSAGELDAARSLVHALKGLSGNLALLPLADLVGELSVRLRDTPAAAYQPLLATVKQAMREVCQSIQQLDTEVAAAATPTLPLNATAEAELVALRQALADTDFDRAEALLDSLAAQRIDRLDKVRQHLDNFDFELAAQALENR